MLTFLHAAVIGPLRRIFLPWHRPIREVLPSGIGMAAGEGNVLLQVRGPGGDFFVPLMPAQARALAWATWAAARDAESGPRGEGSIGNG